MKKALLAILTSTVWISASEFLRNEFLIKRYWTDHYAGLGLTFPAEPINGAVWGLWSLAFSVSIYALSRKFDFWPTVALSWWQGFLMMWLVIGNMQVLPFGILPYAIPLSVLECVVALWLIGKIGERRMA